MAQNNISPIGHVAITMERATGRLAISSANLTQAEIYKALRTLADQIVVTNFVEEVNDESTNDVHEGQTNNGHQPAERVGAD